MLVAGLHLPDGDAVMARKIEADGGLFDNGIIGAALAHVTNFGRAVDIGAHIGTWARQLAGRFEAVVAFEPAPPIFSLLCRNIMGMANVHPLPIAIGGSVGRCGFSYEDVGHNSMGYVVPPGASSVWVPMMRLDDFAFQDVGLVKIDVEGLEREVIRGAAETIARCRPVVVIEENWCSARYGLEQSAARDLLATMGYAEAARIEFMPDNFNIVMVAQ